MSTSVKILRNSTLIYDFLLNVDGSSHYLHLTEKGWEELYFTLGWGKIQEREDRILRYLIKLSDAPAQYHRKYLLTQKHNFTTLPLLLLLVIVIIIISN